MAKTKQAYTPSQDETILKMHRAGYSNEVIGERLGKTRQTIERRVRKLLNKDAAA